MTARLTEGALRRGRTYASLRKRAEDLAETSGERRALEEEMEEILRELERAPAEELVAWVPEAP